VLYAGRSLAPRDPDKTSGGVGRDKFSLQKGGKEVADGQNKSFSRYLSGN
jgi:hypothetical protein